jgi:hypothetical protein
MNPHSARHRYCGWPRGRSHLERLLGDRVHSDACRGDRGNADNATLAMVVEVWGALGRRSPEYSAGNAASRVLIITHCGQHPGDHPHTITNGPPRTLALCGCTSA